MANIKCIDVSTWQGIIDWKKVKAAGFAHAIIRAGFGREVSQIDNQFERNYKNAKAAGVKLGVYWYSYAVDSADALKEANACITILKGKKLEMPVFFDMEESFMTKYSKSKLTGMARAYCDAVEKAGFRAGVYSNLNWFSNYLDYDDLKNRYTIWLAQWASAPQLQCDIWQYSSEGSVSGIDGNVDMNIIYSDDVVKAETEPKPPAVTAESFETALLQSLLSILFEQDVIKSKVSVSNKTDALTTAAILEAKSKLKLEADSKLSLTFVKALNELILSSMSPVGDVNRDGVMDIKDATAIQKLVAGIEKQ